MSRHYTITATSERGGTKEVYFTNGRNPLMIAPNVECLLKPGDNLNLKSSKWGLIRIASKVCDSCPIMTDCAFAYR